MKFRYDGDLVQVEEGRVGTRLYLLRPPTNLEMMAELQRQNTELERIYKLPTLEWLLVKSLILQELAHLARNGWSQIWANKVISTIDQGDTYVRRLEQERDDYKADYLRVHKQLVDLKYPGTVNVAVPKD